MEARQKPHRAHSCEPALCAEGAAGGRPRGASRIFLGLGPWRRVVFPQPARPPSWSFFPCALVVSCFVLIPAPGALGLGTAGLPLPSLCFFFFFFFFVFFLSLAVPCSAGCAALCWCARCGPRGCCVPPLPCLHLSCCWLLCCVVSGGTLPVPSLFLILVPVLVLPLVPCLCPLSSFLGELCLQSVVGLGCCSCFLLGAAALRRVFVLCRLILHLCVLSSSFWCVALPRCGALCSGALCSSPPPPGCCAVFFVVWCCGLFQLGMWCWVCVAVFFGGFSGLRWWCSVVLSCVGVSFSVSRCLVLSGVGLRRVTLCCFCFAHCNKSGHWDL